MKQLKRKSNKGFTLVELIVVIAVLALLAIVAVVAFRNVQQSARQETAAANANSLARHLNLFNSVGPLSATVVAVESTATADADIANPAGASARRAGAALEDDGIRINGWSAPVTDTANNFTWSFAPQGTTMESTLTLPGNVIIGLTSDEGYQRARVQFVNGVWVAQTSTGAGEATVWS